MLAPSAARAPTHQCVLAQRTLLVTARNSMALPCADSSSSAGSISQQPLDKRAVTATRSSLQARSSCIAKRASQYAAQQALSVAMRNNSVLKSLRYSQSHMTRCVAPQGRTHAVQRHLYREVECEGCSEAGGMSGHEDRESAPQHPRGSRLLALTQPAVFLAYVRVGTM